MEAADLKHGPDVMHGPRLKRRGPLPLRDGLGPTKLRVFEGPWETAEQYLVARFPDDAEGLRHKLGVGDVVDSEGRALSANSPIATGSLVCVYRDPPVEHPVPFDVEILHHDENLVVVDKPHFLTTTPRGAYIRETALVRLPTQLNLPELSPAHRLDRLTAGVLVFTTRQELRGAYQMMFQRREVFKSYEAIAPYRSDLEEPRVVRSRMVKSRGIPQAYEEPGEPNAETLVEVSRRVSPKNPLPDAEPLALYKLTPHTGKTHQLRLHMASLGAGIVGDPLYPVQREVAVNDYSTPLQLLAKALRFVDPISKVEREFQSRRVLELAEG